MGADARDARALVERRADAITCPSVPIPPRVPRTGTLSRRTDCVTTINTSAGPLQVVGDLYSILTYGGISIRVVLDTPPVPDYFGLPYIVAIDHEGNPVAARVGTSPSPRGGWRADWHFTPTRTGRLVFLVTGIGGPLSTPAGEYEVAIDYVPVQRRRAVRH